MTHDQEVRDHRCSSCHFAWMPGLLLMVLVPQVTTKHAGPRSTEKGPTSSSSLVCHKDSPGPTRHCSTICGCHGIVGVLGTLSTPTTWDGRADRVPPGCSTFPGNGSLGAPAGRIHQYIHSKNICHWSNPTMQSTSYEKIVPGTCSTLYLPQPSCSKTTAYQTKALSAHGYTDKARNQTTPGNIG